MGFRKFREYIFDNKIDIQERLFMLLSLIALSGMAVAFIISILNGENPESTTAMIVAFVIMVLVVLLGYKLNKVRITATLLSSAIIFIFFPVVFFTSGGIYGGSPIWFVFAMLFTGMIISGKTRVFLIFAEVVITVFCYHIGYIHPELVIPHTEKEFYGDSLSSLVIVGLIMTLMISFQVYILRMENEVVRKQKEEIDELNKSQNRFFSSMSHEIRTPINTIIGLNEMILREEVSPEVEEDAQNIQVASKILLSIINDILDMSKIQSGQMQLSPMKYSTAGLIAEVSSMIQVRAAEKKLSFEVSISPDLPRELLGDEIRIKQILINVLNNAVKYTQEGGVTFSIQCTEASGNDTYLVFTVTDTGTGIKKESIPYLFTAFKRVDEEKNRYIEGTGLGLSIVKELTDLMGGRVTVNSIYGQGSTFIIEIPQGISDRTPVDQEELEGSRSLSVKKVYRQSFEAPEARILAVDDTRANLMVIKKLLRDTEVQLDTAGSAAEALDLTLNNEYNVIFMDHLMPEMDGIECMKEIRKQLGGRSRESKIVALTANADSKSRALYEKEGFDGYVIKPVNGDVLEMELRRLLPPELVKVQIPDENIIEESVSWIKKDNKRADIRVTVSSVADIPAEIVDRYDIGVVPLNILTEGGCFKDGVDMGPEAMLSYIADRDREARIKHVSSEEFLDFFGDKLKRANNIIHISATGKMVDTSYFAAVEAAKSFDNVSVVDSGHISAGQGIMAVEACRMAEEGAKPEDIVRSLEDMRDKIHTSFMVEELNTLMKTGHLNKEIGSFISAFMIRPVLMMKKGRIRVGRIFTGSWERACRRFISAELRKPGRIDKKRLFITHVGLSNEQLDFIRSEVEKCISFSNVYVTKGSPAIAINVGIGSFGLIYKDL